jgi:enoyl-CoA hydratase/carnithine racemase
VRGIVLTGAGRAFSAGEDLRSTPSTPAEYEEAFESFDDVTRAILGTRIPVVAAVNGIAVGGASEITLCCDARIGTPASEYFLPENGRGITISNAASLLLPRLIGNHARRLVLASPRIGAQEALEIELLERAIDLVLDWTPNPVTTAMHLELLRPRMDEVELAFERERRAALAVWDSGVFASGVAAFWNDKAAVAAPVGS